MNSSFVYHFLLNIIDNYSPRLDFEIIFLIGDNLNNILFILGSFDDFSYFCL
jgi:hypothetical protein